MRPKSLLTLALGITFCVLACKKDTTAPGSVIVDISITSMNPVHGAGNTTVTLTGKGFDQFKQPDSILINGKKITITSETAQQMVINIPSLAGSGTIDIWYDGKVWHSPAFKYDSTFYVTTIAGSSTEAGEVNAKGLDARFNGPSRLTLDRLGNIYVIEELGSAIRKIDTAGNVTTLAGPSAGERGYVDGTGPAARFSMPLGICFGADGYLYVADTYNYRIRKVSTAGVVSTFAGASLDNLYPPNWGTDGAPAVATFAGPFDITCDKNGNFYVPDLYNNKIRKISPAGVVSSLAGGDYYHFGQQDGKGAAALFYSPSGTAVDPSGNVYVIDGEWHLLRKITPDGTVTTLLGPSEVPGIPTGISGLFAANTLATDKDGNLYIAVSGGVVKMTPDGKIIRYAMGGIGELDGPLPVAAFRNIVGMAVDDAGTVYISDNNRIRKIAWQ